MIFQVSRRSRPLLIPQFEQQEVDGYPQLVPCDYRISEFKKITSRWQIGMQEKGGWNSIFLEVSPR
jgi:alpha-glucosidase